MPLNIKKNYLLFSILIFIMTDIFAGRVFTAWQEPRVREYNRVQANERARGRTKSEFYHHGLIPMADVRVAYGPKFYNLRVNSLGFRDEHPRTVDLKTSRPRVLFIGDSFTEGLGVDFENTFVGLAAKRWAAEGIEVLNAGVSSYSPIIYLQKIRYLTETAGLEFNHVILFLDLSDIEDEANQYYFDTQGVIKNKLEDKEAEHQEQSPTGGAVELSPKESFWVRNSITMRAFHRLRSFRFFPAKSEETSAQVPAAEPVWDYKAVLGWKRCLWTVNDEYFKEFGRSGLEIAQDHMDELLKLLRTRGISLTLAVYPWADQIHEHDLDSKQVIFWRDWASKNKVDFIDYFPYFINDRPWDKVLRDYFIPGDIHWNLKGHRLIADILISRAHFNQKQETSRSL